MEITVKEIEPCKISVHYVGDAEEVFNTRNQVIEQFKNAPVPGFRAKKASLDAIRMHYKSQIEESLKRALAEQSFHNVLFEKKIRNHGAPKFNSLLIADGKFTCEFELYTKPEFELAPFQGLEIPKPHQTQNVDHVTEAMLQELRVRFGDVEPYTEDDFVQMGDNVILDYQGTIDGQSVEGLKAEGEMLTVGKSQLPEFDQNILAMKVGETREFSMTVPVSGLPSIAGKVVQFKATVNMGSKTIPAALDDELAKKVSKKDYAELRQFVFGLAADRVNQFQQMQINEAVARRLLADNAVNVPNWMSLSEAQYLVHQAKLEWNNLTDVDKEKYVAMGEQNVKLALILEKVREGAVEAQLTDQEVFEMIKQNLAKTKTDANIDDVIKEMNKSGYMQVLFSRIRDEYALDYCVKQIKVVE